MAQDFDSLVKEAERQPFSGWDFSYIHGRYVEPKPSWDYIEIIRENMKGVKSMLELGTGGGERFSQLKPFPPMTFATEGYHPNVALARKRLEPLGVKVVEADEEGKFPFDDEQFELVVDRHTGYNPNELFRVLKHGGKFITQQVGWLNNREIREFFGTKNPGYLRFETELRELEGAGMRVLLTRAESHISSFHDIGALVYYLKAVPWEVPGFSIEKHESKLKRIHQIIQTKGSFDVTTQRYILEAEKP